MKALTVRQPYAYLIATGKKRIENRPRRTSHRGPLAIHAGLSRASLDDFDDDTIPDMIYFGGIVAIVNLIDCVRMEDLPPDLATDPGASGPWCYILSEARMVEPIPCTGKLGVWETPEDLILTPMKMPA